VAGWHLERVPGPQETSSPSAPSRRGLLQWPREKKVTPLPKQPNALRALGLVRGYPWGFEHQSCCRFLKIWANAPRAFGRAPRLRLVSEDPNPPGCEHHQLLPIFEDSKDRHTRVDEDVSESSDDSGGAYNRCVCAYWSPAASPIPLFPVQTE
jgi:hypothetical protein